MLKFSKWSPTGARRASLLSIFFFYLCVAPTSLRDTWHQHLEYKQKQCQKCKALIFNIARGAFERKWCAISHKWANPHAAWEVQKQGNGVVVYKLLLLYNKLINSWNTGVWKKLFLLSFWRRQFNTYVLLSNTKFCVILCCLICWQKNR